MAVDSRNRFKDATPLAPTVSSGLRSIRRHLAPILLFSGVAVLGYAGFQYGAMLFEQRHLQTIWRNQQRDNRTVDGRHSSTSRENGLSRISIPNIGLSAVVVEGTDLLSLMVGPGHFMGTVEPGEPGNAVLSAHRDTFFRNIEKLHPGDPIFIEREGQTFRYEVIGFKIVKPNDVSVVAPTSDSRLTLVTCDPAYYPGPAPQRLVMFSKLISPMTAPTDVATFRPAHSHLHVKHASSKSKLHAEE